MNGSSFPTVTLHLYISCGADLSEDAMTWIVNIVDAYANDSENMSRMCTTPKPEQLQFEVAHT